MTRPRGTVFAGAVAAIALAGCGLHNPDAATTPARPSAPPPSTTTAAPRDVGAGELADARADQPPGPPLPRARAQPAGGERVAADAARAADHLRAA